MMLHCDVAHLLAPYNFKMHMYPDDIQAYSNSRPDNVLQYTHESLMSLLLVFHWCNLVNSGWFFVQHNLQLSQDMITLVVIIIIPDDFYSAVT